MHGICIEPPKWLSHQPYRRTLCQGGDSDSFLHTRLLLFLLCMTTQCILPVNEARCCFFVFKFECNKIYGNFFRDLFSLCGRHKFANLWELKQQKIKCRFTLSIINSFAFFFFSVACRIPFVNWVISAECAMHKDVLVNAQISTHYSCRVLPIFFGLRLIMININIFGFYMYTTHAIWI